MNHRSALVTGASQGLGLALARRLAGAGWSLVVDARHVDRLDSARSELGEAAIGPARIVAVAGDITDPHHRHELVAAASSIGPLHLVVNNASTLGASPLPSVLELDVTTLHRILDVNVVAPVALIRELVGAGMLHEHAVVVNISSDAAAGAYPGWGGYGSSKAALDQIGNVLAAERPDWRVLTFDPGDMRTEMHQAAFPGEDIGDRPTPEHAAEVLVDLIDSDRPSGRYSTNEAAAR
jgi:NAD(P)-dependent dehydrogenase (short-subunit alcohol dehydrogenase family)